MPRKLLLADHPSAARDALAELLTRAGLDVECVSNAHAAVEELGRREFDLAILEVGLPSSYEVPAEVARHERPVQLIAVGVGKRAQDFARSLSAGFSLYMPKPLSFSAVLREVGRLD